MKTQIMLDIETLGTRPGSAIVSIGAVKFGGGQIVGEFYERIDMQSAMDIGLTVDASTIAWWLKQGDAARAELTKPAKRIGHALEAFAYWIKDSEAEVWGNGVGFDNVLLATAYAHAQLPQPWVHWNDRCYRTMKALHTQIPMERAGTHHHALDDAKFQAVHLMKILSLTLPTL
jgi:exodeoxyribonuclease VIII